MISFFFSRSSFLAFFFPFVYNGFCYGEDG